MEPEIDWSKAPPTATHYAPENGIYYDYWAKKTDAGWEYRLIGSSSWHRGLNGDDPKRFIPRPGSEAYDPRNEATHTHNDTGRPYKRGPNTYSMVWGLDDVWRTSRHPNTDLDDPRQFTPIQRNAPSTEIVFTMTEEQSKAIALDKRPMKVVMVQFQDTPNAKEYAYWAPEGTKTGDYAVVHQNGNINTGSAFPFTVVKVTQDEVLDTSRANKAILGTFDESFALHVQARIEHMTRVKAKLAQKKKAFEESAFYEMLAKSDPEAAALLDELKQFNL